MAVTSTWHSDLIETIVRSLNTSLQGRQAATVAEMRRQYGTNRLPPPHLPSGWRVFANQLRSPLVAILIVAVVVSFFLREWRDGSVILMVVLFNALIGWRQERQSDRAVLKLLHLGTTEAHVIRDGQELNVPADDIVVGDLVVVDTGDRLPADGRWVELVNVRVDESTLTGESLPVVKTTEPLPARTMLQEQTNMGWRGTTVIGGRGRIIVTAVGAQTRYGGIVTSLEGITEAGTPFQRRLGSFSRRLFVATIVLGGLLFGLGLIRHLPLDAVFLLTVSLIVSVIPEGLPVVITMAMAWGMWAMAKRQAIVRKLMAVETLGAVTVVATDKTGTLTYGEMMVERLWVDHRHYTVNGRGYDRHGDFFHENQAVSAKEETGLSLLLRLGALNNDSRFIQGLDKQIRPIGDPTELALLVAAAKGGWTTSELEALHPRLGEIPFDTSVKHMVTWHRREGGILGTLKGAPAEVLDHCHSVWTANGVKPLNPDQRQAIMKVFEDWARQGLRGLAAATVDWQQPPDPLRPNEFGQNFTLVGLFGMADAIRPEAPAALQAMQQAGVRTIMLTGDYQQTGIAIGRKVGLVTTTPDQLLDGSEMTQLPDQQLIQRLATVKIATRLTPEHKLRIAKLLKQSGQIVAMTGDGINDAPALMEADVGIAVGRQSSDAAKEAADVLLVDGNYDSIVAAIVEGRRIYRNIRRALVYLLASNFGELGLIVIALLSGLPLPLLPTQIIWLNALTDPFLGIALAREPVSPLAIREKPHNPQAPIISRQIWQRIVVIALTLALSSLAIFIYGRQTGRTANEIFALTLTTIAFGQWVLAMTVRSSIRSTFSLSAPNPSLFVAFVVVATMQVLILYVPPLSKLFQVAPLSISDWLLVAMGVAPIILVEELQKWRLRQKYFHRPLMRPKPI